MDSMSPARKKIAARKPAVGPDSRNSRTFASPRAWAAWLGKHHATSDGLWIRFYKKASDVRSLTHAEALHEALCWGWIDGQAKPADDESWYQRFTPRRARSGWSSRNRELVKRLEEEGRMQPAGRAQVQAAKADGRWDRAYDPPSALTIPEDFLEALEGDAAALAFFRTLNRANLYAITYRLQTARKPETRQRRLEQIVGMMKEGKKFH
jgi:uncharacterized protein YdeI (YjbR/CyaY-like superfamily)